MAVSRVSKEGEPALGAQVGPSVQSNVTVEDRRNVKQKQVNTLRTPTTSWDSYTCRWSFIKEGRPESAAKMVYLVVKRSESQQFLYETTADTDVEEVLQRVVNINNLRYRIQRVKQEGDKLAVHAQGDQPTSGNVEYDEHMEKLQRALAAAELLQHKDQVARKVALTEDKLQEAVEDIRRAAAEAYPGGLPAEEPFKHALDGTEDPIGTSHDGDELDASEAELWFASKKLPVGSKVSQHVGRNEKTKAVVKLQHAGYGRPPREQVVDKETQKAMLAYYHKKQEDEKRLAADDTMYFDSAWANPKSLKNQFSGVGNVRLS